jgi:hypothetical protein
MCLEEPCSYEIQYVQASIVRFLVDALGHLISDEVCRVSQAANPVSMENTRLTRGRDYMKCVPIMDGVRKDTGDIQPVPVHVTKSADEKLRRRLDWCGHGGGWTST